MKVETQNTMQQETQSGGAGDIYNHTQDSPPADKWSWLGNVEPDVKSWVEKQNILDPTNLAVKAFNQEQQIGKQARLLGLEKAGKLFVVPDEGATQEEKAALFERLGVPKDVKDYGVEPKEGDDIEFTNQMLAAMKAANVTKNSAQAIIEQYRSIVEERRAQSSSLLKKELEDGFTEWKASQGAKVQESIALAKRGMIGVAQLGLDKSAIEAMVNGLKSGGISTDGVPIPGKTTAESISTINNFLMKLGSTMREHSIVGEGAIAGNSMDKATAASELAKYHTKGTDEWEAINKGSPDVRKSAMARQLQLASMM